MRVLITGGDGFIGRYIEKYFMSKGHSVKIIDIKSNFSIEEIPNYWFNERFDMIIHCAAFCVIRECIANPSKSFENNSHTIEHMLEYARRIGCKKFIHFSSSRVLYPDNNVYTATKKYGEALCKAYKECYGIDYIIIRPSTVFGPEDNTDRLVPRFINNALQGKTLEIYGDEKKTLDVTFIGDFMNAFVNILAFDRWNTEWNIGSGVEVKVIDIAKYIVKQTKIKAEIALVKEEISQPQHTLIDIRPLRAIGYKLVYGWKFGVDATIKYWTDRSR